MCDPFDYDPTVAVGANKEAVMAKRDPYVFNLLVGLAMTSGVVFAIDHKLVAPGPAMEREVEHVQAVCLRNSTCARVIAVAPGAGPSPPRAETPLMAAKRAVGDAQQTWSKP